jgi:hypothetical protein
VDPAEEEHGPEGATSTGKLASAVEADDAMALELGEHEDDS